MKRVVINETGGHHVVGARNGCKQDIGVADFYFLFFLRNIPIRIENAKTKTGGFLGFKLEIFRLSILDKN